jgi:(5-formylfuran-3-yl)methyl phosphate synthase
LQAKCKTRTMMHSAFRNLHHNKRLSHFKEKTNMRLMISVVSAPEANQALLSGTDLLDIKNPAEGSLGAQFPSVIREIRRLAPERVEISAAIGDMPNLPGTAALAALGAATCGVDYIKIGLHGTYGETDALKLLSEIRKAVLEFPVSVIAAAYADFRRIGSIDPHCLPDVAAAAGVRGCLIDTAIKDGSTVFDFVSPRELRVLASHAHSAGLLFGVAGALRQEDLRLLEDAGVDVAGLRTAVCRNGQRSGPLDPFRLREVMDSFSLARTTDASLQGRLS